MSNDFLSRHSYKPGEFEQQQAIYNTVCEAFKDAAHPFLEEKICKPATAADVQSLRDTLKNIPLMVLPRKERAAFKAKREAVRPDNPDAYREIDESNRELAREDADTSAQLLLHYMLRYMRRGNDEPQGPVCSDVPRDLVHSAVRKPPVITEQGIRPGAFAECAPIWNEICQTMKDRYDFEPRELDKVVCTAFGALSAGGKDVVLATDLVAPNAMVQSALARPYAHS